MVGLLICCNLFLSSKNELARAVTKKKSTLSLLLVFFQVQTFSLAQTSVLAQNPTFALILGPLDMYTNMNL